MKKLLLSTVVLMSLGLMAGCSNTETTTTSSDNMTQVDDVSVLSLQEATKMYKDTYPDSEIYSVELKKPKKDEAKYEYKIKGFDGHKEYSVKIDGVGRTVTEKEHKDLDGEKNKTALDFSNLIGINEAGNIAEEQVSDGYIKEWKLKEDKDTGEIVWKVEVKHGVKDTDVKINASNGEIISVEKD